MEESAVKWSPGETNPFNASGGWTGSSGIHLRHLLKFNRLLNAGEKTSVENALARTPFDPGTWIREHPSGTKNSVNKIFSLFLMPALPDYETPGGVMNDSNATFTLSKSGAGLLFHQNHPLHKVASGPAAGEYSMSGTGITLGTAPTNGDSLIYWRGGLMIVLNNHFVTPASNSPDLGQYSLSGREISLGAAPDPTDRLLAIYAYLMDPGLGWFLEDLAGTRNSANDLFSISKQSIDEALFVVHTNLFATFAPDLPAGGYHQRGAAIQMGLKPDSGDSLWAMYAPK